MAGGYKKAFTEREIKAHDADLGTATIAATEIEDDTVGNAELDNTAGYTLGNLTVTGSFIDGIGVGSPIEWGYQIQAGSATLSSNTKWVSYPKAFTGLPIVNVNKFANDADEIFISDAGNAGSFQASGANATDEFMWLAIGLKA